MSTEQKIKELVNNYEKALKDLFTSEVNGAFDKFPKLKTIELNGSSESNDEGGSDMYVAYDEGSLVINGNRLCEAEDGDEMEDADLTLEERRKIGKYLEKMFDDFDDLWAVLFDDYGFEVILERGKVKL